MSIAVPLDRLRASTDERGPQAYVLTVCDDARPHAVHGTVRWERGTLIVDVGRRSAANAAARPAVSLLYPVRTDDDYSLIVDGTAAVLATSDGHRLLVTPTKAVLHRHAPRRDSTATGCDSDCVVVLPASQDHDEGELK